MIRVITLLGSDGAFAATYQSHSRKISLYSKGYQMTKRYALNTTRIDMLKRVVLPSMLWLACGQAEAHGPGPGMLITCTSSVSGVPSGGHASVTVKNAATGQIKTLQLGSFDNPGAICVTINNAAFQAGLRSELEGISAVAIYGSKNSVSVSFARISEKDF
jgi:hypothetical protein